MSRAGDTRVISTTLVAAWSQPAYACMLVTCFVKIEEEVHCVGAGLVPARTAACCGPPGGHKGRPYEGERLAPPSIWLTRSTRYT
jgi:hypothetical protein